MNILEHYILEVLSVEDYVEPWAIEKELDLIEVTMVVNCYGQVNTAKRVYVKSTWEFDKKRGYYLA